MQEEEKTEGTEEEQSEGTQEEQSETTEEEKPDPESDCKCGSGKKYKECCGAQM